MTEEAKLIVNTLRACAVETQCSKCVVFCGNDECLFTAAANLIESMSAQLDQVTRERDAAVEDLRTKAYYCETCAHYTPGYFCPGCRNKSNWQWRGVEVEG